MTGDRDTGPGGPDEEARLDEIEAGIDETRDELSETVAAIGERLEPGNLAREAGETVRSATMGKVDDMTTGAQQTWSDIRTGNPQGIVDTIRSNPIPAGMVVAGVAMLLMKRGSQDTGNRMYRGDMGAMGRGYDSRYRDSGYGYGYDRDMAGYAGRGREGSEGGSPLEGVGDTVARAGDKVGRAVGDMADNVSSAASDFGDESARMARMRTNQLVDAFNSNPVGFGIAAVAAGAALGLLLPSTPVERQALGPARDKLVEQAGDMVHETLDKVEEQTPIASGTGRGV